MIPRYFIAAAAVALLTLVVTAWSLGGPLGCRRCGCVEGCQKVCRLEQVDKKVTVTCWGIESADFCLPGPSKPGCKHCELVCDEEDPKSPCTKPQPFSWYDWIPGCATVHTKQKLMKKTVTKTIPSYKWVVEDLCPACATAEGARATAADR